MTPLPPISTLFPYTRSSDLPVLPRPQLRRGRRPATALARPGLLGGLAAGGAAPPVLPEAAPLAQAGQLVLAIGVQHGKLAVVPGQRLQPIGADPGLDLRSAPGSVDQAHGHVHGLLQLAGEEIAGGGEV